jgi:hypothetical protein
MPVQYKKSNRGLVHKECSLVMAESRARPFLNIQTVLEVPKAEHTTDDDGPTIRARETRLTIMSIVTE